MKTIVTFLVILLLTMGKTVAQTTGTTPVDGSGNTYSWVKIGDQYWMSENLKTTKFANGDDIPTGHTDSEWVALMDSATNTGTSAYATYPGAVTEDGLLYNWFAATDARGICPEGWKVPSDEDWIELEVFAGMLEATARTLNWRFTNTEGTDLKSTTRSFGGTDIHGFNALPSGFRKDDGTFASYNSLALFWTSQQATGEIEDVILMGWRRGLRSNYKSILRYPIIKHVGQSIRCMKSSLSSLPSINNQFSRIESETIYCLSGQKVYCPIENISKGIYVKKIRYENGNIETKKFVVNK